MAHYSHDLEFQSSVTQHFAFLETECGMKFRGIKEEDTGDPRDHALIAQYLSNDARINIGWNSVEGSLGVLIRSERNDVLSKERYVYLEPFIEFLSHGAVAPIVPQYYVKAVFRKREQLLANGLSPIVEAVANRLRLYIDSVLRASPSTLQAYHQWLAAKKTK
jgi:hypothetical protein